MLRYQSIHVLNILAIWNKSPQNNHPFVAEWPTLHPTFCAMLWSFSSPSDRVNVNIQGLQLLRFCDHGGPSASQLWFPPQHCRFGKRCQSLVEQSKIANAFMRKYIEPLNMVKMISRHWFDAHKDLSKWRTFHTPFKYSIIGTSTPVSNTQNDAEAKTYSKQRNTPTQHSTTRQQR